MNRKILVIPVLLLVASMACVSLVQATATEPKNNTKFETFSVLASFNIMVWFAGQHEYIPSMDNVNLLRINWDETFLTYAITVGSTTYHLGTDFTYTGHVKYTFHDVTSWATSGGLPPYVWPKDYTNVQAVVDYTYDFSAVPGGIDGTLHMLCVMNNAGKMINSLDGTGDLQNVQIKAEVGTSPPNNGLIYSIVHNGIVSGWPE